MALVICSECNKQISDKAVRCIGCGAPLTQGVDFERPVHEIDGVPADKPPTTAHVIIQKISNGFSVAQVFTARIGKQGVNWVRAKREQRSGAFSLNPWFLAAAFSGLIICGFTFNILSSTDEPIPTDTVNARAKPEKPRQHLAESATKTEVRDTLNLTRYVKGNVLNFRDAPGGNKLGSFSKGTKLAVYAVEGKWYRVSRYGRAENWVHADYVSANSPWPSHSNSMDYQSLCSFWEMEQWKAGYDNSPVCEYVHGQLLTMGPTNLYFQAMGRRALRRMGLE